MKNLFLLFIFLLLSLSLNSQAQVSTYTFSPSSGVYTEIAGDTVVAFATTTTTLGPLSMDDSVYANNSLPFPFTFNGNSYSNVVISCNGFITFGSTLPLGNNYVPISNSSLYAGAMSAEGNDLIGNRGITATRTIGSDSLKAIPAAHFAGLEVGRILTGTGIPVGATVIEINQGLGFIRMSAPSTSATTGAVLVCSGSIVRGTTGSAGNRVHTIQFKNVRNWTTSANANCYNFQIKLYETSNRIEVVYGTYTVSTTYTPQIGLRGAANSDFNNRTSTTSWASSAAGTLNTSTMTLSSTVLPSSGQTYTWFPFVQLANDVGTTAILAPTNASNAGSIAPKATIKNFGTNNQNVPFNIVCKINPGGYTNTQTSTLAAGASTDITFANFLFAADVAYNVTVYTDLATDQNRNNDTQKVSVSLIDQNYGNNGSYYFANSLATNQPSYPEYCWKDTTGSKNLILDTNVVGTGTIFVGTKDDGYFKISLKSILAELGQDTLIQRSIKFNGVCYDSIFPSTNGIVGLTDNSALTSFSPILTGVAKPSVYPYWRDFDWRFAISGSNRMSIKIKGNQLILTYDRVQQYNSAAIGPDYISFQTCFELVNNCADPNSNIRFSYADSTAGKTSGSFIQKYISSNANTGGLGTHLIGLGTPTTFAYRYMNPNFGTAGTVSRPMYTANNNNLSVEFGPNQNNLNIHDCLLLHVALTLQGLQSNGSNSTPRVRDTVEIIIRDAAIAPYKILQKYKVLLDSAYNNSGNYSYGYKDIDFTLLKRNYPYYLEIMHRSSVFVWSNPVSTSGDILSYDFTTGIGKTYGNNAVVINGTASMYSGDIASSVEAITQDGCVTLTDLLNVYNESLIFAAGPYVLADLNYDGIVDLSDLVLVYNNNVAFICGIQPPGAVSAADFPAINLTDIRVINNVSVKPVTIVPDPNYVDKEALQKEALLIEEKK